MSKTTDPDSKKEGICFWIYPKEYFIGSNKNKKYEFPHWHKWDKNLRKQFLNIANDYMQLYNYSLDSFL